jgi:hypothetical protein
MLQNGRYRDPLSHRVGTRGLTGRFGALGVTGLARGVPAAGGGSTPIGGASGYGAVHQVEDIDVGELFGIGVGEPLGASAVRESRSVIQRTANVGLNAATCCVLPSGLRRSRRVALAASRTAMRSRKGARSSV